MSDTVYHMRSPEFPGAHIERPDPTTCYALLVTESVEEEFVGTLVVLSPESDALFVSNHDHSRTITWTDKEVAEEHAVRMNEADSKGIRVRVLEFVVDGGIMTFGPKTELSV